MLGLKKHSMRGKYKFSFEFRFSCASFDQVHNCDIKMESGKFSFLFKKLEVFGTDTCCKEHLPSKNHEMTKLDKSPSVCDVGW